MLKTLCKSAKAVNHIVKASTIGVKTVKKMFDYVCFFRVTQEKTVKRQDHPGP